LVETQVARCALADDRRDHRPDRPASKSTNSTSLSDPVR
jgi:hypothetical protein